MNSSSAMMKITAAEMLTSLLPAACAPELIAARIAALLAPRGRT
jgi:hypothetical protein